MSEPDEATIDDAIREAEAISGDQRRWLACVTRLIEAYSHEPTRYGPAQDALDSVIGAACARAKRILRSDLTARGQGH